MGAPAKFLFDRDFGRDASPGLTDRTALVAEAEARGYANGIAAGENAAREAERRAATALTRIATALEETSRGLAAIERRLEVQAVEVAVAVAGKLAPALIAREPFAEIAALVRECFTQLLGAPHVVIRLNDALSERAGPTLREAAEANGFTGRLVILAEPDIEAGDCRIEWADGGIIRDRAKIEATIGEAVRRFIDARTDAATRKDTP